MNNRPPSQQDSSRRKFLKCGDENFEGIGEDQRDLQLSVFEKKYLLCAERGDVPAVRELIDKHKDNNRFNINCRDAVGRTALVVAIENENMELIDLLLNNGIEPGDALLHAINEQYVEAVEVLLQYEEKNYAPGRPYSWEAVDIEMATFTKDITPLILAAHRDNYEIIKLLLDRGASLPMPHNVRCGCDECVTATKDDCLRHSRSRINAYKALTSPSLICLSSTDPIQTAFNLSSELAKLSSAENEFKTDYKELRLKCEQYATALLDHTRTSYELEVMLNYDPNGPAYEKGERMKLERLKLAILCKQKTFVAHPNVQQLLAAVWYEGSPGFRRKGVAGQLMEISKMGMMFPVYSTAYMLNPESPLGQTMKKPFTKFICHSTSYCFFLFFILVIVLLIMASQRVETLLMQWIGTQYFLRKVQYDQAHERGKLPGLVESAIVIFVIGFVWAEIKQLWDEGLYNYLLDMWNVVDFLTNMLYLTFIGLRVTAFYIVHRELSAGLDAYIPREDWDPYDPMLISEGIFGAANIFSFLKMVHIFSVNPHLGPLQISLGRMVFDIIKFFFIYSLVLFAFGCGMNQLLWYYADIDKELCYSGPNGAINPNYDQSCLIWRRFANLFETSQSLFWASFGLVELENFELTGIKSYTRFWSLLMFGSYSVINVVVLLNLLIAMMSNSYNIISERSDVEWKFARSKLWMSYFEDGSTVPPPFNIIPTPKFFKKLLVCKSQSSSRSLKNKEGNERDNIYRTVMRCLVRRYVTSQQLKAEETGVTEDDVNEVKQAVTSFRSELFDILRNNGMKGVVNASETLSRKERLRERRLLKDFNIDIVESVMEAFMKDDKKPRFSIMRRMSGKRDKAKRNWNALAGAARSKQNHIGSSGSHGGSLKELRDKVLREQELPPMRGVRRFAHAARRVLHDEQFRSTCLSDYDNANNIAAIEEEVPGTFSATATPRNSIQPQNVLNEETTHLPKSEDSKTLKAPEITTSKSPKTTEDTSKSPKAIGDTSKSLKPTGDTTKSPKVTGDTSKSPKTTGDTSKSPKPTGDTSKSPKVTRDRSKSPKPTGDRSKSPKPTGDTTKSPKVTGDTSKSPKTTGDTSKSPKPTGDTSKSPKPTGDTSKSPKPTGDTSKSPKPTGDTSKSPKPTGDTSKSPKPTGDTSKSPKPTGDTSKSPKPTGDTSKSPKSTGDTSKSPKPTGDTSTSPKPAGDTSKSPKSTGDTSKSPKPTGDISKSPKITDTASKPGDRKNAHVIVNIEKDEPPAGSKRLDSYPPASTSESKPKDSKSDVKVRISQFDDGTGKTKEDADAESRRQSEPKGDKKPKEDAKKRKGKIFPEDEEEDVAWL